jgi:hypothetical protein
MEFFLPEVYSSDNGQLYREKDVFLEHYQKLEKQRFLHCLMLEFQCRPELLSVDLFVCDEQGNDLDADLTFADSFDTEETCNFWEVQAAQNAIQSAYVAELRTFCDGKTFKRSDLLNEDHTPRFTGLDDLLSSLEST